MPVAPTHPQEIIPVPDAPKAPHLPSDLPEQVLGPPPRPPKIGRAGGLPHGPRSRPIRIGQTAREAAIERARSGPIAPRLPTPARGRDLPIEREEDRNRPVGGRPLDLAARRAAAIRDRIVRHRTADSQAQAAATPGATRRERVRGWIGRRFRHQATQYQPSGAEYARPNEGTAAWQDFQQKYEGKRDAPPSDTPMSDREVAIDALMMQGMTREEAARKLDEGA